MNRSLIKFFTPVLFIFCFIIFTTKANACICVQPNFGSKANLENEIKNELKTFEGVIFRGKVIKIERFKKNVKVTLEVEKYWKSEMKKEFTVNTFTELCGVHFYLGQTYYLKIAENKPNPYVFQCERLDFYKYKKIYLKHLGKSKKPE